MKKNTYQAIIVKTLCALTILEGGIHAGTLSESIQDLTDTIASVSHQAMNEVREIFEPQDPWENFAERLENIAIRHSHTIERQLDGFVDRLPDVIARRVDGAFVSVERTLNHFTR